MVTEKDEKLQLADLLIENEEALASYYEACIDFIPENRERWEALKKAEERHAELFREIKKSIQEKPMNWQQGKFYPQTVRLMLENVKEKTELVKKGEIHKRYAISFIEDIENSLIEEEILFAFRTDLAEFQSKMVAIQEETSMHKKLLTEIRLAFEK
ncbi:hypothetical protein ACFL35_07520 [Candidatus Riflebacteria bacterium]